MTYINPTTLLITLNMIGLNNLIKRQRFSIWVKKDPSISYLKDIYFIFNDTNRLKVKAWKIYIMTQQYNKVE